MKFNRFYFSIVFWSLFVLITAVVLYQHGRGVLDEYEKTKGEVVDIVYVSKAVSLTRREDLPRPQISYNVGDTIMFFVDHDAVLEVGAKPTILYRKNNSQEAHVYTIWHWIDMGIIVPALIFASLAYSIIIILNTRYKHKAEVLPSNF